MAGRPRIWTESVTKAFAGARPVLRDVSVQIEPGEFVSVVGPSGCGKSTLLRLVAGLIEPTRGRVTVAGRTPTEARDAGHRIAFVFQEPTLLPWRNVRDNIRLPMELQGVSKAEQAQAVEQALRLIGLVPEDTHKYPRMLSGGMRMRVSLARALVTNPDVLLLDEPFAALDDLLRLQWNEELHRIWSERRFTTLFVTHNVGEAVFLSQRIVILRGRPGTVATEIEVPFPLPRSGGLRASAEFARLSGAVLDVIRRAGS